MNNEEHIKLALREDQYKKDVTTKLLLLKKDCKAILKAKETFYIYGLNWFKDVFKQVDKKTKVKTLINDGAYVKNNEIIAEIYGSNHSLLRSERVALNYLQTMSGTYDLCIRFKKRVKNKKIKILHTRKTIPLFRRPLRDACVAAGCMSHREDLSAAVLIKENHLQFAKDPNLLIQKAIKNNKTVVVEAKTLKFAKSLSRLKIDRILLDNFTSVMLKEFLSYKLKIKIEVSGSISLDNINRFALKGVDYISIGALTKNIESKDLSMLIV